MVLARRRMQVVRVHWFAERESVKVLALSKLNRVTNSYEIVSTISAAQALNLRRVMAKRIQPA